MVKVRRVQYVSLPVHDLEEAKRFYCDFLGMTISDEVPGRWLEISAGNVTLALYPQEEKEVARGGELALETQDIEHDVRELRASNVPIASDVESYSTPTQSGRLLRFKDPSGNKLELVQPD